MFFLFPLATALLAVQTPVAAANPTTLPLGGVWKFQLDATDVGVAEKWYSQELGDTVQLPGTTNTNQKGKRLEDRPTDRLVRVWSWIGPAWYQREVTIPESWDGKRIILFFERTKNTRMWVDDGFVGIYQLLLGTAGIKVPEKLTLTLAIEGTSYCNCYPVWVYLPKVDTSVPKDVLVASSFAANETRNHLAAGGKVLQSPKHDKLPHSVRGGFQCGFWSPMFAEAVSKRGDTESPGTLGFLCDPAAPALACFPTEFHSGWQWWQLVKNSRPIAFDYPPRDFRRRCR